MLGHASHQVVDGRVDVLHVLDAGGRVDDLGAELGNDLLTRVLDLEVLAVGRARRGAEELELVHLGLELHGDVVEILEARDDGVALAGAGTVQLLQVVGRRVLQTGVVRLRLAELVDGGFDAGDTLFEESIDAGTDAGVDPLRELLGLAVAESVDLAAQAEVRVRQHGALKLLLVQRLGHVLALQLLLLHRRGHALDEVGEVLEEDMVGLLLADDALQPVLGGVALGLLQLVLRQLGRRQGAGGLGSAALGDGACSRRAGRGGPRSSAACRGLRSGCASEWGITFMDPSMPSGGARRCP